MPSSTPPTSLESSEKKPLSELTHSRRQYVSDTSDDSGHISIEQYIYRRDQYRSTSFALPIPLPMIVSNAPEDLKNRYEADEGLRMAIFQVLQKHDIRSPYVSLEAQVKLGYPAGKPS